MIGARARWLGPGVAFAVSLAADQVTKILARDHLTQGRPEVFIDGFWNWELAGNPGAAFSTFGDENRAQPTSPVRHNMSRKEGS